MKQIITSVTAGGQVTLPAEVRRLLGVRPRDKVAFAIEDHEVRLVPIRFTLESAAGSVKPATNTGELDQRIDRANEEMASESTLPVGKLPSASRPSE
ncbi:MAG TPA: AbrB/MazE/SpoVT family DNA-binding domain-containing protein [Dehalococcoidia bacterium]|nr:AbrB/MazE/SpoVT family DNA-binding domain-containing protein [Dehalococcoidia bacterium]